MAARARPCPAGKRGSGAGVQKGRMRRQCAHAHCSPLSGGMEAPVLGLLEK